MILAEAGPLNLLKYECCLLTLGGDSLVLAGKVMEKDASMNTLDKHREQNGNQVSILL